ncbi:hypothetical protein CPC08DRAFT_765383 [Agrocybe pediades]|nr:hypothetical protein CPC08DRAFT_765383 [Agrocybe pediades]
MWEAMLSLPNEVKIPKPTSQFMHRLHGYFHVLVLVNVSRLYQKYCNYFGIPCLRVSGPSILFPLPFNTVLKFGPKVREDQALAMDLAHRIGLPAPRLLSYGGGLFKGFNSIWMTLLPREPLSQVWQTLTNEEMKSILSVLSKIGPAHDEEFLDQLLSVRYDFNASTEEYNAVIDKVKGLAKHSHSIVLTHGDLYRHNILVKNARILGLY